MLKRKILKQRFLKGQASKFNNHDLIETLLDEAIPYPTWKIISLATR